jgi:TatD DNase family protein
MDRDAKTGAPAAPGKAEPAPAAPPLCVDAHAHLAMPAFTEDLDAVLRRASEAGIAAILTAATTLEDAGRHAALAEAPRGAGGPAIWAAAGVHPHEAKGWRAGDEARLEALLARGRVVAVGECGLDYHYGFSPPEAQRDVFARQVRLAARLGLPLVVHCREAAPDVAAILDAEGGREAGGVLHCFTEDEPFARRCIEMGFFISFSGIVTFRKAEALRAVARGVPEERLLVETDAPYLAPEPRRGARNEPARAADVLLTVASLRGADPDALGAAVRSNFHRLLRKSGLSD